MSMEVTQYLKILQTITPTNIHLRTNIRYGPRVDFESIWNHHGPMAARYYLLPLAVNGSLEIK